MKQKFISLFFLIFISSLYAQSSIEEKSLFTKLDSIQGYKNLALLNGVAYRTEYRTINDKHSFFQGRDSHSGKIIYDTEVFYDIDLRYDLFRDILITTIQNSENEIFIIQLISDLVDSFEINGHTFNNIKDSTTKESRFYELLHGYDHLNIYKKQRYTPLEKRDRNIQYYEFEKQSNEYYISSGDLFFEPDLSKLKDVYPDYEDDIEKYFKSNRSLRRKNYERFLDGLGNLIQELENDKTLQ